MRKSINRSKVAMMAFFFAVSISSCKKEDTITPEQQLPPAIPVAPPVPPPAPPPAPPAIPPVPLVSFKPSSIVTTEEGRTVRKQLYVYDNQGKLTKYFSSGSVASDSVIPSVNSVIFKKPNSNNAASVLSLNGDKTFKSLFNSAEQFNFGSNGHQLQNMFKILNSQNAQLAGTFTYIGANVSKISSDVTIDINYFDNLPYQKGINEIPARINPVRFYKVIEQENSSSTILYNKLIRQIIITEGRNKELHEYTYTIDASNRVTLIKEVITLILPTGSTQKTQFSSISY